MQSINNVKLKSVEKCCFVVFIQKEMYHSHKIAKLIKRNMIIPEN